MFSLFLFCRLIFLVLLSKPFFLEGARILSLFPVPSPSHFHYVLPYLKNLASLGHEITSVSPYHLKAPVSNIREILLPEVFDSFEDFIKAMTTPKRPPRPYVPNVIEVGGMHINQATKALPKELEDFIQGAGEHGVIYFSLGTNVKTESLSEDRKKILIETFESLPQRVLWKFEDDELPGKPSNVLISNWFPQQDILSHPKVRLFITHGGMQSTIESIYFGKPMLGLPFFYDQFGNMEHIKRKGLGLVLNFKDMTKDQFRDSIHRLLTEKSFEELARKTSSQYHDQPMKPRETAIWWTHYVLRHKGAPNMQVAGRKLNFFIYHSLDVLCTLLLAFVVILAVVVIFVINVLEMILGRQIEKNPIKLKTY
ncbi:UDP-glucuronosyltransferase 2A3-like isoform X4 [Drosophila ficusphila]|uniref:UDP-glucuronosyltransferase 2A3-like isoform X4 n=1 Tax=Drosophila ficusphila TaxID=30025 RepID=UPI001C8A0E93|nr:UDP-glucuronosyltransferase 2A3-like isoform X4 [Drosophila ficusphila]